MIQNLKKDQLKLKSNMSYCLTKHAKDRYFERFGKQDTKIIEQRCELAAEISQDNRGVSHRKYGAICFVVLDNIILTVKKYKI
jgi:hypothetical protein